MYFYVKKIKNINDCLLYDIYDWNIKLFIIESIPHT